MITKRRVEPVGVRTGRPGVLVRIAAIVFAVSLNTAAQVDSAANQRIFDLQLQQLLREGLSANPALKAAGSKAAAVSAMAAAKKSLNPPLVAVDFYQAPISSFPNPIAGEVDYVIQQEFPFPGKLAAMSGAEKKRSEMLLADSLTLADDLIRDVKNAYFELYLVDRQKGILRVNRDLLINFEEIARKEYEVGIGKQSDVLRAQTEISLLINDSIALEQNRISLQAMVNALRNKPVDSSIPFVPEIQPAMVDLTFEKVGPFAEASRPELKSMMFAARMQEAELNAAKKEYYPDFMVRGMYKQMRDFPDDWELMLGMTVPIAPWSYKKYSAGTRGAHAQVSQATYDYSTMRNEVSSQVRDALAKVHSNQAQIQVIRGTIIPQARQTLQSTVASYQTGKQDFLTLIDTERMLLDAELKYHRAVMLLLASRAALERAVGLSMDEIEQSVKGSR